LSKQPVIDHASILYLSEADVAACTLTPKALRAAVSEAFAAQARGSALAASKSVMTLGPGHVFQAKPALMRDAGVTCVKWFGLVPPDQGTGPSISSTIVLSDVVSGMALAIMGGDGITARRTAAMTAIAAEKLARSDSRTLGLIGAGVQGHSHLEALCDVLPGITDVVIASRTSQSAARLADAARARGLRATVTHDPRQAVDNIDVIITTVPEGARTLEFLDPDWVSPGAFVGAVDLARSWQRDKLSGFDLTVTDEHEQTRVLTKAGRMTWAGPYDAELSELCSGKFSGRVNHTQRVLFNFSGHALADLAAALLVYETAQARGIGMRLPR
jgi:ornithine cyclodeaminase/alanine dehydrogenase-like protein (mu-crystallin family)